VRQANGATALAQKLAVARQNIQNSVAERLT
jgi:hypothetical protein